MDNHELDDRRWTPPHCPAPTCKYHKRLQPGWRFKRMGSYFRLTEPRRICRFRCLHCGVTFGSQTIATTYWLKDPEILPQLVTKVTGEMCNSQIATDLDVATATIDRQRNPSLRQDDAPAEADEGSDRAGPRPARRERMVRHHGQEPETISVE
ncbi:MAG: hypothetical protein R6X25_12240 [Candidatus Krumholzibacteriia bacterium]